MTTITDADLERLGFERFAAAVWRRDRSGQPVSIAVRGGVRAVWIEQSRGVGFFPIVLDHIKTPQQLEQLVAVIQGDDK